MAGKSAVNPRRIDFSPGLPLQIPVSADVSSVGVGVIDGGKPPAVGVQNLPDFAASVLIVAAVNQANALPSQPYQPDLCRTLDVMAWIEYGVVDLSPVPGDVLIGTGNVMACPSLTSTGLSPKTSRSAPRRTKMCSATPLSCLSEER